MKIIQRLDPNHILVRYETGLYEDRTQTSLSFENNYADALRTALSVTQHGYQNVQVVQYRETLHYHSDLLRALEYLNPKSTDAEVIDSVKQATSDVLNDGLAHLAEPRFHQVAAVWECVA